MPVLLTIAGFDPTCGAGIAADLKVFAAHGFAGVAAITALTVQTTVGVRRVAPVDASLLAETLAALCEDLPPIAIKIGMLATAPAVQVVSDALRRWAVEPRIPVVLDPVLVSSSGHRLLDPQALDTLRSELLPLVSAVTPNLHELHALLDEPAPAVWTKAVVEARARELAAQCPRLGVVVTGGHLPGAPEDFVLAAQAAAGEWMAGERVLTPATHGTGCGYSSALACGLASGLDVRQAAQQAKRYVTQALRAATPMGAGGGSMHHLFPRAAGDLCSLQGDEDV